MRRLRGTQPCTSPILRHPCGLRSVRLAEGRCVSRAPGQTRRCSISAMHSSSVIVVARVTRSLPIWN